MPDSAGGEEVSMGVIKKLPRYAHVYTHKDGHILICVQIIKKQ